ncbi:MAG TPA: single-stranded DNA-binding protein [Solirubrobacteraceae bacterium]|jgi:single-strand DNA-binding protein|nr:single-stranded DNA-binding protein [Solirubrobacteraceae bacterium]
MSTSAPNVNQVTLVGHLTADPVLRSLPDGRSVCDMRLAVNDQRDQPPLFIDVASFGASADACAKYLAKGRAIAVTGRLVYREWEADDGSKRSKHQVIGRVRFGGRPDSDTDATTGEEESEIEF